MCRTGVVEGAVVLEEDHLAVEVNDLLPHLHHLLSRVLCGAQPVLQLLGSERFLSNARKKEF